MSRPQEASPNVFHRLASLTIRLRWGVIALLTLASAFFLWQMQDLKFNNAEDIWFVEGDPTLERIKKFRTLFGNDDFVFLVFDSESVFTPATLGLMAELVEDLKRKVPYVKSITWLGNAEHVQGDGQSILISDFLDPADLRDEDMPRIRERALGERLYVNNLISSDGRSVGIILEMAAYPSGQEDPRSEVAPRIRAVLENPRYAALSPHMVGQPILHHDYNQLSLTESRFFFGLCLLIQAVLLFRLGRGVRGVAAPLCVMALSVIWTLGMIGVMGYTLNLFIILIPTLLVCVGIGDSMHIIATYLRIRPEGLDTRSAMRRTLGEVGWPCLLTSLTTAAGFLSFNVADIRPFREMGVYAATGTMMAFLLSLLVVPLFYGAFGKGEKPMNAFPWKRAAEQGAFDTLLRRICRVNVAAPRRILAAGILLMGVCLVGYRYVEVETNTARMLSPKLPLRQAYDHVDERMGGSMAMEIMLDTGIEDGVKNPEFLRRMDSLQERLDANPLVTKTASILDLLKEINQTMHGDREEFHTLPSSRSAVAQYMLLYEMSDGRELDKLVSFRNDVARLTARTRTLDTKQVRALSDEVENHARELFGDGVKVEMTGSLHWMKTMNDLLGNGQRQSFLAAALVVTMIMIIALRSLKLGLISMVPNILPVLAVLGLMGFAGLYMDMPLMSFSAVIIGVAVDDTIHFLLRYRKEFSRLGSYAQALEATLTSVGRPLVFTTLTLVAGFSVLLFSDLIGVAKFGGLAAFAFTWALLADFFLLPSMLLTFKPLGAERTAAVPTRQDEPLFAKGKVSLETTE
ncbi:MAG: MMPL family transporter [Desulfocurvibacter africanus]